MQKESNNPCKAFENEVWLYISGELSAERKKMWDGHLTACGECSGLLSSNREFTGLYKEKMEVDLLDSSFDRIIAEATKKQSFIKRTAGKVKEFNSSFTFGKVVFGTTIAAVSVIALLVTNQPQPVNTPRADILKWDDTEQSEKISEISVAISHLEGKSKLADAEWAKSIKGIESKIDSLKICINN